MGVDQHPQKRMVIEALMSGESCHSIASWLQPPLNDGTVRNYMNNVFRPQLAQILSKTRCKTTAPTDRQSTMGVSAETQRKMQRELHRANREPILSVFRERLEALYQRTERSLDKAEAINDLKNMAPLLNQGHKNMELLGRATGELEQPNGVGALSIQIVCPSAPEPDSVHLSIGRRDESPLTIDTAAELPQIEGGHFEDIGLIP